MSDNVEWGYVSNRPAMVDAQWKLRAEKAEAEVERLRAAKHCGCAWCCTTTPPEQRGDAHKRTCRALEGKSE